MKGYKYAMHANVTCDYDTLRYEIVGEYTPVLVVLDIPDEALKSTPTLRYSDYLTSNKEEYVDYYRYASTDMLSLLATYTSLAKKFNELRSNYIWAPRRGYRRLEYFSTKQNLDDIDNFIHVTKCRCNEAKVVDIIGIFDGKHYDNAVSTFDYGFVYELNSTVKPDDWGSDTSRICGHGIHYFEYPILALLYKLQSEHLEWLNDDFKNTYLTEELNKLEGDIRGETKETSPG